MAFVWFRCTFYIFKLLYSGPGDMTQSSKFWLYKHEDLSLNPQHLYQVGFSSIGTSDKEIEARGYLGHIG